MARVDGRFKIEGDQIIKISNGEAIPDEEPVFIMRARDRLLLPTLRFYRELCVADGCNDYMLGILDERIVVCEQFAAEYPERMKQPGITRGK